MCESVQRQAAQQTAGRTSRVALASQAIHLVLGLLLVSGGCATIPQGHYGVERVEVHGMEKLDEQALLSCLATQGRDKVRLGLGVLNEPQCGRPPFSERRAAVALYSWPWTSWPVYDEAVLRLDIERVERWLRARGYYGAQVERVDIDPKGAAQDEECKAEDCSLEIALQVTQGKPVRVRNVKLAEPEPLPFELREELQGELRALAAGSPFDEAIYDQLKAAIGKRLREHGYARAKVRGTVSLHRGLLWADVTVAVELGSLCKIGKVRVETPSPVPETPILLAAGLESGRMYRESDLDDAQRAVYAIGAFSAVSVHGDLDGQGELVDIVIRVEPRRRSEVLLGAGLMSGALSTGPAAEESVSVPQWDTHLFARYEHRNFFGGLRRFQIEERPRLMFLDAFPGVPGNSPRFGNAINASFSQPGVPEARTSTFVESRWDYGPDPFLLFFRHDMGVAVGVSRGFFRQRLSARLALHQELLEVARRQPLIDESSVPASYRLPFVEEVLVLDLRDDAANPSRGAYFRAGFHEAVRVWDPSWSYVRLTPEARGYVPLGMGLVLAARFATGSLHIFDASQKLDAQSQRLGPQVYRLRGGGAQSNRGFGPGQLGDGLSGGIRRWESSLELRVPLAKSFSVVAFSDVGDVHAGKTFRFSHLNTAVGGGLRYRTVIGPLRLDVGYRPAPLQRAGSSAPRDRATTSLGSHKFAGAIHLTIGESF